MTIRTLLAAGLVLAATNAHAQNKPAIEPGEKGNASCWGDNERQDISCRQLTETLLMGMRFAKRADVIAAMGVEGRERRGENGLHFTSNYGRGQSGGSGIINFMFDQSDRAAVIFGSIDQGGKSYQFLWNAERLPSGCSDLPNSRMKRC